MDVIEGPMHIITHTTHTHTHSRSVTLQATLHNSISPKVSIQHTPRTITHTTRQPLRHKDSISLRRAVHVELPDLARVPSSP